jgi:quinoprotein glucose dehydrogenase
MQRSTLVLCLTLLAPAATLAQTSPPGEWRYWGADAASTRYSSLDQIDATNFEDLEVAWTWKADNYGPTVESIYRATPIYADGRLFTVAGRRRTVVAIDPATGETLWTYREPHTTRWERSWRQSYGKGVAYAEVDGRGVIYMVSPGFFLHALDAETGLPVEGFGHGVPLPGFGDHGVVDLLEGLGHPLVRSTARSSTRRTARATHDVPARGPPIRRDGGGGRRRVGVARGAPAPCRSLG